MKVLHVIAQLPDKTGSGIYYKNLVNGFENLGATNGLVYAVQPPYHPYFEKADCYPVQFQSENLPFQIVGMSDEMPYPSTIYSQITDRMIANWQASFKQQLLQAQQEFQPDIIITHHLWMLTSLVLEVFGDSVPIIGISHGTDLRQAKQHPAMAARFLQDFNQLSQVFALSHSDAQHLQEIFHIAPEKIQIMGGGFNQQIFYAAPKRHEHKSTIKLLYAGKIAEAKGVFELASAFHQLKQTYPHLELTICGNTTIDQHNQLSLLAGQETGFYLEPALPQAQLAERMREADLFILPSYYEGIALITIEALACQMRVVTTEIPALQQLLGQKVNESGVITYVELPALYDVDKPVESEKPGYIARLVTAISRQIELIASEVAFPTEIYASILTHSWDSIIQSQYKIAQELVNQP